MPLKYPTCPLAPVPVIVLAALHPEEVIHNVPLLEGKINEVLSVPVKAKELANDIVFPAAIFKVLVPLLVIAKPLTEAACNASSVYSVSAALR